MVECVTSGSSTIGTKGLLSAVKVFSLMAIDPYNNPTLIEAAKTEFEERRGADFTYVSLLGDRAPGLDYPIVL